jgi:hypothetical protein
MLITCRFITATCIRSCFSIHFVICIIEMEAPPFHFFFATITTVVVVSLHCDYDCCFDDDDDDVDERPVLWEILIVAAYYIFFLCIINVSSINVNSFLPVSLLLYLYLAT